MLFLTRRLGETIHIGDDIAVRVIGIRGNQVHLGVDAPKNIAVHREEVYYRIQRQRQLAADNYGTEPYRT